MKFRAKNLNAKKLLNGNTEFSMEVEDKQNRLISQLNAQKQLLNSDLEVGIDKWRNKRSGGHNRLFWDMCGYLSDHINDPTITQMTIYRDLIREYGVSKEEGQQLLNEFFQNIDSEDILFTSHGACQDYLTLKENDFYIGDTIETLCTYELAKEVLGRKNNLTANDVALECGYYNPCNHNAYGDALSTIIILSYLLKKKGEL